MEAFRSRRLIAGPLAAATIVAVATATIVAVAATTVLGVAARPAAADSVESARADAVRAAATVDALQPRVEAALAAYENALDGVAHQVTRSLSAAARADAAAAAAHEIEGARADRVRAVYISGGAPALYAGVFGAGDTREAIRRLAYIERVMRDDVRAAEDSAAKAVELAARAAQLDEARDAGVVTAGDVRARWDALAGLLQQSELDLTGLDGRVRELAEAQAATARRRAGAARAGAGTGAGTDANVTRAEAVTAPEDFRRLYVAAAGTCPGLSWTVLSAIGQVETGHGRITDTSYAGAQGPMQFMPATFAAYGVDGNGDGDTDVLDPADAVFSAAHYLCASGAGTGADGLRRALFAYNHAQWYVELILDIAGQLPG